MSSHRMLAPKSKSPATSFTSRAGGAFALRPCDVPGRKEHGKGVLQAKLKVGAVDDAFEREADRVADAISRSENANVRGQVSGGHVQRACAACSGGQGACPKCEEESRAIQRKPSDEGPAARVDAETLVPNALAGGGAPLAPSTRSFMESRFGRDFSQVRIHAGRAANDAASALGARAFTLGRDVVFGANEYAPDTPAGRRLVAHELTHVVQQAGGAGGTVQRQGLGGPLDMKPDLCVTFLGQRVCGSDAAGLCSKIDLPGCSAVCRVFGCDKKSDKPKATCPPGWRAAGSKGFEGQCCPEGTSVDSAQSCCPSDRVGALDFRCCKPDEVVSEGHCKKASDLPPVPLPQAFCPPPGKRTLLGNKCCFPPEFPFGLNQCSLLGAPPGPPTSPPQPQPPKPTSKLPEATEIFFRQDRPGPGESASALTSATTSSGKANFDELVRKLEADPARVVQLVGRASPEGPKDDPITYNRELGARRARMVAAALQSEGIAASRLADPSESDLRAECEPIDTGLVTCGMAGATGEGDREVLARVFTP
ncbi:DUF4157 domain-containing protein [Pendulispora albinea]|uniref:DUF4157 domain-containing protein n=1 Tax=Pendulispora albinea TaxID=2741071 RepID=A0ABZ2MAN8_9BACT